MNIKNNKKECLLHYIACDTIKTRIYVNTYWTGGCRCRTNILRT